MSTPSPSTSMQSLSLAELYAEIGSGRTDLRRADASDKRAASPPTGEDARTKSIAREHFRVAAASGSKAPVPHTGEATAIVGAAAASMPKMHQISGPPAAYGVTSKVYRLAINSQIIAVKVPRPTEAATNALEREYRLLRDLHRDRRLIGLQFPLKKTPLLDSKGRRVVGYCAPWYRDGDLMNLMEKESVIPVSFTRRIARRIIKGLAHLHRRDLIHRDLKPENILLSDERELGGRLIGDIGDLGSTLTKDEFMHGIAASLTSVKKRWGDDNIHRATLLAAFKIYIITPVTPDYSGYERVRKLEQLTRAFMTGERELVPTLRDIWELEKRADVHSLALTLSMLVLNKRFHEGEEGWFTNIPQKIDTTRYLEGSALTDSFSFTELFEEKSAEVMRVAGMSEGELTALFSGCNKWDASAGETLAHLRSVFVPRERVRTAEQRQMDRRLRRRVSSETLSPAHGALTRPSATGKALGGESKEEE